MNVREVKGEVYAHELFLEALLLRGEGGGAVNSLKRNEFFIRIILWANIWPTAKEKMLEAKIKSKQKREFEQ